MDAKTNDRLSFYQSISDNLHEVRWADMDAKQYVGDSVYIGTLTHCKEVIRGNTDTPPVPGLKLVAVNCNSMMPV